MRYFILLIFVLVNSPLFAQDAKTDSLLLRTFVQQLKDQTVPVDIIISQHLIVEHPSDDLYDYLEASLEEIRLNLQSKDLNAIIYTPILKAPRKEIRDIDLGMLNPDEVYLLFYQKRQFLALYLRDGKVASFTLVSNGKGKAEFVLY